MMPVLKNKTTLTKDETRLYRRRRRSPRGILLPERRSRSQQAGLCDTVEVMVIARNSAMSRANQPILIRANLPATIKTYRI
jgi:hypothetical protein